jgi:anaerobic selenocysteine-containing dehydrogenase
MHPDDAADRGLADGDLVTVRSGVDAVVVPLRITDELARGVVSLPHGFSTTGTPEQRIAQQRAMANHSANANRLAAAGAVDLPSGTAALNGIPVICERAGGAHASG